MARLSSVARNDFAKIVSDIVQMYMALRNEDQGG